MSKKNVGTPKSLFCDYCGRSFRLKANLIKHILIHTAQQNMPRKSGLTCLKCNIVFKNKGLLMCHNVKVHVKKSLKYSCQACQLSFFNPKDLKFHVREFHFNLLTQVPYCEFKKVNQVWFEKVLNSNSIVEIKKVAENILLMRKLDENTALRVGDHSTEVLDLHSLYPTHQAIQCGYCSRMYDKCYINKHITDVHMKYKDKAMTEQ